MMIVDSLKWSDSATNFCIKNNPNETSKLETAKKEKRYL